MAVPVNIRANVRVPFPALVQANSPLSVTKTNGVWTFNADTAAIIEDIINSVGGIPPNYRATGAAPVTVQSNPFDGVIGVDTVAIAAPWSVILPTAASRNGVPLTIKDVSGQAGNFQGSFVPVGTEKIDDVSGTSTLLTHDFEAITLLPITQGAGAPGWLVAEDARAAALTVSDTAPAGPNVGDLWWDSTTALLYIWYNDGTSSQWVNANNLPPSPIVFGAPSASIGITPITGSATTVMRSDAAPALSQSIAPTWSAVHTFNAGLISGDNIKVANATGHSGFINAGTTQDAVNLAGGTFWNGTNWIATDSSASVFASAQNGIYLQTSPSGQTVGSPLTSLVVRAVATAGGGLQFQGTTTNDNAQAGFVGEVIESQIANGTQISLSSGVTVNVTQITLTPGDWDVGGTVSFVAATTSTIQRIEAGLADVTATIQVAPVSRTAAVVYNNTTAFSLGGATYMPIGPTRWSIASNTTIYLVANVIFGTSTAATNGGHLWARRRR